MDSKTLREPRAKWRASRKAKAQQKQRDRKARRQGQRI